MPTLLNFNLFGNVLHRRQTNKMRILDLKIIYDGDLCDNIMLGSQSQSNSNLDDRGIVELSLYAIIFNFHDEIQRIGGRQRHRGLRHFTNWCFLAFLGVRNLIYWFFCWKIVVLWQINLHPGLSTKCYFEWKHLNKLCGCPKPGNAPFRNK